MQNLICLTQKLLSENIELPFSVYSSVHEQNILNIPITKPVLIFVISGKKEIGSSEKLICNTGSFIFLSDNYAVDMRNIPNEQQYLAILIEFNYEDFESIPINSGRNIDYFIGDINTKIEQLLTQFIEISSWIPESILSFRKKEILMLLYYLGHKEVAFMMGKPKISHKIHDLFIKNNFHDMTAEKICILLAMSESTLRRKLKLENTSIKEIKDKAKLGLGLHLLQTTEKSIHLIAEKCGYQSPSRFSQSFKQRFGLTPSVLRKTKKLIKYSIR